jgi:hypothetical protein
MPELGTRLFRCNYNCLANEAGRAASAAERPKYIFLIQLPLRCEEKTCFFKPIRRPGEHNFYI